MSRDRLQELQGELGSQAELTGQEEKPPITIKTEVVMDETTLFLQDIQHLQEEIEQMRLLVEEINDLYLKQLLPATEVDHDEVSDKTKQHVDSISKQLNYVKKHLKRIDEMNEKDKPGTQQHQIRIQQTATCRKRFMDTAKRYQQVQQEHRERFRALMYREYKIAHPTATEEEINEALAAQSKSVFADDVLNTSRHGEAKAVLKAVQQRHDDVKKIENTILELNALFQEMAVAVEQQGDLINSVETSMTNAAKYTEEGTGELAIAIEYKIASRRKLYVLICIGFIVLLIVIFSVYTSIK